jgi:hypothetical protein
MSAEVCVGVNKRFRCSVRDSERLEAKESRVEKEELQRSINLLNDAARLACSGDNAWVKLQVHMIGAVVIVTRAVRSTGTQPEANLCGHWIASESTFEAAGYACTFRWGLVLVTKRPLDQQEDSPMVLTGKGFSSCTSLALQRACPIRLVTGA